MNLFEKLIIPVKLENKNGQLKKYLLVMEYADGNTLRTYLKDNFKNLTWEDKFKFAYQLSCALSCLHDEGIVHRDLVIFCYLKKLIKQYFTNYYIILFPLIA